MKKELLDEYIRIVDTIKDFFSFEFHVTIYDANEIVLYHHGDTYGNHLVGQKFRDPTGALQRCIETGKKIYNRIPVFELGVEMEGNLIPIFDKDEVVGAIVFAHIPYSRLDAEARYMAIQSMYYLMLYVDMRVDNVTEMYRSIDTVKVRFPAPIKGYSQLMTESLHCLFEEEHEEFLSFCSEENIRDELATKMRITHEFKIKVGEKDSRWVEVIIARPNAFKESPESKKFLFMVHDIHERHMLREEVDYQKQKLIDRLNLLNDELQKRELTDELTGLYNRKGVHVNRPKIMEEACRQDKDLFVLIFDMDGLKYINDHFGHMSGDQAICACAKLIEKTFGEDDLVSRIGGDEFSVYGIVDRGSDRLQQLLHDLEERMEQYNQTANLPYDIAYSYGYYQGPVALDEDISQYERIADANMYECKEQRRIERVRINIPSDEGDYGDQRSIGFKTYNILVADADEKSREDLKSLLVGKYNILEAKDEEEAIRLIMSEELILIVLDYSVPPANGLQILKRLKEEGHDFDVPILFFSDQTDSETELAAYEYGVSEFITKPYTPKVVQHRFNRVINVAEQKKRLKQLNTQSNAVIATQSLKLSDLSEQIRRMQEEKS